ncbi:MAG: CoA transferase, partial [Ardenticatenaceae bacterium]
VYPCAPGGYDDYVMIHLRGHSWETVLAVMGRDDLIGDERYATDDERGKRADEDEAIISEWTTSRTKYEAFEALASAGVWSGPVLSPEEVIENEHLIAREMIVNVPDEARGDHRMIGCPVKLEKSPATVTPAPRYSEHTDEILTSMLGVPGDDLPKLRKQGVIV